MKGHGKGTSIWTAAPAAVEVVVEQLGRARQKRPESRRLIVVPRVMTGRWPRHLTRGVNFYFRLNSDKVWPLKKHFEPLLIFVTNCQNILRRNDGVFCANFFDWHWPYVACEAIWCEPCYKRVGEVKKRDKP